MREILFRGKRKDNGEWVEGRLLAADVIVPGGQEFILEANCIYGCDKPIIGYDVDKETVGQFTGLTDKNGKKIFEGDIVKLTDEVVDGTYYARVEFGNPNGMYTWGWQLVPLCKTPFAVDILHWVDMEATGAYIEVIGNIHDNPELLEGKRSLNQNAYCWELIGKIADCLRKSKKGEARMTFRELDDFLVLCKKSGFRTMGEVNAYMRDRGLNCRQLFHELDAICFPEFI